MMEGSAFEPFNLGHHEWSGRGHTPAPPVNAWHFFFLVRLLVQF
jgi:hypothetical protein